MKHHDLYTGSIVESYRFHGIPQTCRNCSKRRKDSGCQLWKSKGLDGSCSAFAFGRFASYDKKATSPGHSGKGEQNSSSPVKTRYARNHKPSDVVSPDDKVESALDDLCALLTGLNGFKPGKRVIGSYASKNGFHTRAYHKAYALRISHAKSFIQIFFYDDRFVIKRVDSVTRNVIAKRTAVCQKPVSNAIDPPGIPSIVDSDSTSPASEDGDKPVAGGSVLEDLSNAGFTCIDRRSTHGCFWILASSDDRDALKDVIGSRARLNFLPGGCKATKNMDAWWLDRFKQA